MPAKKIQKVILTKNFHEYAAWAQNGYVCGLDEVGRGCLAGPLVTAAVILKPNKTHKLLKDSKVLTQEERLKAAKWIAKNAWFSYGIVHHRIIDQHNIWQANLIAMKKAFINVMAVAPGRPMAIVVDAMPLSVLDTSFSDIPVHFFPKGERRSVSIAAASIMAKVMRDHMMTQLAPILPGYGLEQHKGYSTSQHMAAVKNLKPSIIHRTTFLKKLLTPAFTDCQTHEEQQSLC
ncbi:MAG: ribonuclease HII [Candidatus Babeliales bacterium]|nr:ribonuclease HII [Candidatus Babeliales bacterium]